MNILLSALMLIATATSQSPARDALVVSPAWVAAHLNDRDLVLLHVGEKKTYDAGHLPGARYVDFGRDLAVSDPDGLRLEMLPADVLRDRLAALGISDNSRVIVYQSDDFWTPSTRVMFTLDYAGLSQTAWMDGGLAAWTREGRPTTTEAPPVARGTLSPLKLRPIVVDAAFVQQHANMAGFAIVDARAASFYKGERAGSPGQQPGHIPGALSVPFDSLTSEDVHLKPADEIRAMFERAGVKPGDTVVTYCHIGQQATATAFAARTAGYKVLLYDGSFQDWSRKGLPVER